MSVNLYNSILCACIYTFKCFVIGEECRFGEVAYTDIYIMYIITSFAKADSSSQQGSEGFHMPSNHTATTITATTATTAATTTATAITAAAGEGAVVT